MAAGIADHVWGVRELSRRPDVDTLHCMAPQSPLDKDRLYLQAINIEAKEQFMLMSMNWRKMAATGSEPMSEAETRQLFKSSGMPDSEIDLVIASARNERWEGRSASSASATGSVENNACVPESCSYWL